MGNFVGKQSCVFRNVCVYRYVVNVALSYLNNFVRGGKWQNEISQLWLVDLRRRHANTFHFGRKLKLFGFAGIWKSRRWLRRFLGSRPGSTWCTSPAAAPTAPPSPQTELCTRGAEETTADWDTVNFWRLLGLKHERSARVYPDVSNSSDFFVSDVVQAPVRTRPHPCWWLLWRGWRSSTWPVAVETHRRLQSLRMVWTSEEGFFPFFKSSNALWWLIIDNYVLLLQLNNSILQYII